MNANGIDHVQSRWPNSLGAGERAGYYDQGTGALARHGAEPSPADLMCLVAMEPPHSLDWRCGAGDEKLTKVLRALRLRPREARERRIVVYAASTRPA